MGDDRAVVELGEGVDDGLALDEDAESVVVEAEQVVGLDEFETLVEHGGAVDGDLGAHVPGRVVEGLLGCGVLDLLKGSVAEGAA